MLGDVGSYDSHLPWLVPGIAVALVVSVVASGPVARWLGARRPVAWLIVLSTGTILAITLTPLVPGGPPTPRAPSCDFSRIGLASIDELSGPSDALFNILMFIPLGFAIALAPRSSRKAAVLTFAFTLPLLIEATQLGVTPLGRACQSWDVIDNLIGLVLGLIAGTVVAWLAAPLRVMAEDPR